MMNTSDRKWGAYLLCHRGISRRLRKVREAAGHFYDLGRYLVRMQKRRLYAPQFDQFVDCVSQEWQISPELATELILMTRIYNKEQAIEMGLLPVPVIEGVRGKLPKEAMLQAGVLLRQLSVGKLDQEKALRAQREAIAAGRTEEEAQAIANAMLKEAEEKRTKRAEERAKETAKRRKPGEAVPWIDGPGAEAPIEEVEACAKARAALRVLSPQTRRLVTALQEADAAIGRLPAQVVWTGPEPGVLMEQLLGLLQQIPGTLAGFYGHLPEAQKGPWLQLFAQHPQVLRAVLEREPTPAPEPAPAPQPGPPAPRRARRRGVGRALLVLCAAGLSLAGPARAPDREASLPHAQPGFSRSWLPHLAAAPGVPEEPVAPQLGGEGAQRHGQELRGASLHPAGPLQGLQHAPALQREHLVGQRHGLRRRPGRAGERQRQVAGPGQRPVAGAGDERHGALQLADVAGPAMAEERLQRGRRQRLRPAPEAAARLVEKQAGRPVRGPGARAIR
jgi:hypothetical protein